METFQEHLNKLEHQLQRLPFFHQLAFAASCCERAVGNYVAFAKREGWGNAQALRTALTRVWELVEGASVPLDEIKSLELECRAATPDSDDFGSVEGTAAQEAAFMITLLLQFCYDRKPSYAVGIATFARDTIDMFADTREGIVWPDPAMDRWIANHPLMVAEVKTQKDDLAWLQENTAAPLREFRKNACSVRKTNIGLPID